MAEFPHLGKQCHLDSCSSLDFLPFLCKYCRNEFCKDHSDCDAHCCADRVKTTNMITNGNDQQKKHLCSFPNCSGSTLVELCCSACGLAYCMKHRNPESHHCACLISSVADTKSIPSADVSFVQKQIPTASKAKAVANTVALMRLKGKAIGLPHLVPEAERFYLLVSIDTGIQPVKETAAYVSSLWTVGRCIDALCKLFSLSNANNKPNSRQLRLYSDGDLLNSSATISELVSRKLLFNGIAVQLKYD